MMYMIQFDQFILGELYCMEQISEVSETSKSQNELSILKNII